MESQVYLIIALKIIIGFSILNVWLLRPNKKTKWRGGEAKTITEEFEVYGLSKTFYFFVFITKVSLALVLLASIKFEVLTLVGSLGLAVLLFGSVLMHLKVRDPWHKSFPALLFMILNLVIVYYHTQLM